MGYPWSTGDQLTAADLNAVRRQVVIGSDQTGSTYTLVLTDAGALVEMNKSTAQTLTVPPNSSVAFPTGTRIAVRQKGAGQVTFSPGSGVTLQSFANHLKTAGQYAVAFLVKVATDTWILDGTVDA
jgi:hypothetical protein